MGGVGCYWGIVKVMVVSIATLKIYPEPKCTGDALGSRVVSPISVCERVEGTASLFCSGAWWRRNVRNWRVVASSERIKGCWPWPCHLSSNVGGRDPSSSLVSWKGIFCVSLCQGSWFGSYRCPSSYVVRFAEAAFLFASWWPINVVVGRKHTFPCWLCLTSATLYEGWTLSVWEGDEKVALLQSRSGNRSCLLSRSKGSSVHVFVLQRVEYAWSLVVLLPLAYWFPVALLADETVILHGVVL